MSTKAQAEKIIKNHILWSMGAGLMPIPIFDIAAVTAVQVDMLHQLATLYEVDYTKATGKTFVAALAGTTFAKIGASLVKSIPGVGSLIGGVSMSVLSGASTYAVGQVAVQYFETGDDFLKVDLERAKEAYKEAFEKGKEYVSSLKEENSPDDVFKALEKLDQLREKGVITEDEFETKKQELLDRV